MARRRFQIFRKGTHIASDGTSRTYSDADMKKLVAAYDPTKMKSPLVFGHPKTDEPAFGAMVGMEYDEATGKLFGDFDHIPEPVSKQIDEHRWLAGSLSLYTEDSPTNPVKGSLYPKHFGLLGAVPPAVKGMDDLRAHADGDDVITIEFQEDEDQKKGVQSFVEAFFAFLTKNHADPSKPYGDVPYADPEHGKYPIDTKEHVRAAWSYINMPKNEKEYSSEDLAKVKARIEAAAKKFDITINHQETEMDPNKKPDPKSKKDENGDDNDEDDKKKYAELQAKLDTANAELARLSTVQANSEKKAILDHVEGLSKSGQLLPVFKAPMADLLLSLPNAAATVEFGEGDEKQTVSPRQFLLSYLDAQGKVFQTGMAKLNAIKPTAIRGVNLPAGMTVDPAGLEFHESVITYMEEQEKAGKAVTYSDAAIFLASKPQ